MISHLPLVVPVTWAVIAQSVGEAGARQECPWEACWGPHHNWPPRAFSPSTSPAHESCTQATGHGELHFTWTKCLSEGPTHHTHENRNFSESPGPLESSPTTQRPRNTGEASHTTAGFQQGTRGSLGLGSRRWCLSPRSTSRPQCRRRDLSTQFSPVGISTETVRILEER